MPKVIATEEIAARNSNASMMRSLTRDKRRAAEDVDSGDRGGEPSASAAEAVGCWRAGISFMAIRFAPEGDGG